MDKILNSLKGNIRVNEHDKTVEVYNEWGVHMKLHVDDATLDEYRKHFPTY